MLFDNPSQYNDWKRAKNSPSQKPELTQWILFETQGPDGLNQSTKLPSQAFDQKRINKETTRCCCTAGFSFKLNKTTQLQYFSQQEYTGRTGKLDVLIQNILPDWFIALALLISFHFFFAVSAISSKLSSKIQYVE